MGRAPCCDKANVKKGPWSPEEDAKLKAYIEKYGTGGNWIALPQKVGNNDCLDHDFCPTKAKEMESVGFYLDGNSCNVIYFFNVKN